MCVCSVYKTRPILRKTPFLLDKKKLFFFCFLFFVFCFFFFAPISGPKIRNSNPPENEFFQISKHFIFIISIISKMRRSRGAFEDGCETTTRRPAVSFCFFCRIGMRQFKKISHLPLPLAAFCQYCAIITYDMCIYNTRMILSFFKHPSFD
jgi:hypothetical protein